jgi:hypothetical protein
MIGEVEFRISEMENTLNRIFGIVGIKIIVYKTVQQQLDRIQDYNSP